MADRTSEKTKNEYLYVIFSSTPYKMGRFIRFFTKGFYNHISISVNSEMSEIYSFARRYRKSPFCGGFVRESGKRFKVGDRSSTVCICKIPVEEGKKAELVHLFRKMRNDKKYIYNFFSAVCVPIKHKVPIRDAYTCVEFTVRVLHMIGYKLSERKFYSVEDILALLSGHVIYEGDFPKPESGFRGDDYERHVSYTSRYSSLVKQFSILAYRKIKQ